MPCVVCGKDCSFLNRVDIVPLNISRIPGAVPMAGMHTLTQLTYVNADKTKVVAENSPEAAYVLGGPGSQISMEDAVALGLASGDDDAGATLAPSMNPDKSYDPIHPITNSNPGMTVNAVDKPEPGVTTTLREQNEDAARKLDEANDTSDTDNSDSDSADSTATDDKVGKSQTQDDARTKANVQSRNK